ncbi:response regulator [Chryseobacterium salivictor]|uniref:Nitrogen regulation protein NR(I) n=1 Tax=Chryseobacterium salivictor TaxID=2547600 RepID=A0A4P6ZE70_9FLAO|nr:response regulator [Chryseobacterium salivictor]QBO57702.1 Nitrogen regulation protein NR(I) [Chryseobacterium salivictor]
MKILIVDDNKDICQLIESILLADGYDIQSCCNPSEFHEKLKHAKPELIITDMLMSGFDGRTLTKDIKNNSETADIKVMLMSAHPDAAQISNEIGADDFLAKPFEIDDLVDKVERLLN